MVTFLYDAIFALMHRITLKCEIRTFYNVKYEYPCGTNVNINSFGKRIRIFILRDLNLR